MWNKQRYCGKLQKCNLIPESLQGTKEKLPCSGKPAADISSCVYDIECHAKKCVERYCELANRTPSNCTKLQLHALMTINSKPDNETCKRMQEQKGTTILRERVVPIVFAWSESGHGFDRGRVWRYVPWLQTPEREQVVGRFHYDGGILDLPSDWDWSESKCRGDNTCEEPGPNWAFSMTDALEGILAVCNGWTQTMFEQQILDCNASVSGCQGGTQRQLSLQCSWSRRSWWVDVSSRDRPTLTASVEEGCEIHKPNYHNQSRQQQQPHKQTRKHELALAFERIKEAFELVAQDDARHWLHAQNDEAGLSRFEKWRVWREFQNTFRVELKATEWSFDRIKESFEKVAQGWGRKAEHCTRNNFPKLWLPAAYHRASWRTSHNVTLVPAL